MSDQARGPGWWVASDGKWYPPETHPNYRPPPPPPPQPRSAVEQVRNRPPERPPVEPLRPDRPRRAKRERERKPLSVWKVALGVMLGLFLFVVACSALISSGVKKVSDDANKPAVVRIEAVSSVCWSITLTGTEGGNLGQSQHEGCGAATFDLPPGLGANAIVSKRTKGGEVIATVEVDGKETARQSVTAEFGSATVSR